MPKTTMRPIEDINEIFEEMEQGKIRVECHDFGSKAHNFSLKL
ncbi:hypothetical protein [Aristophania vespae]|nr:hypothetical protein [Aristophania vespae]